MKGATRQSRCYIMGGGNASSLHKDNKGFWFKRRDYVSLLKCSYSTCLLGSRQLAQWGGVSIPSYMRRCSCFNALSCISGLVFPRCRLTLFLTGEEQSRRFVGGGSGITPVNSLCEELIFTDRECNISMTDRGAKFPSPVVLCRCVHRDVGIIVSFLPGWTLGCHIPTGRRWGEGHGCPI